MRDTGIAIEGLVATEMDDANLREDALSIALDHSLESTCQQILRGILVVL